MRLNPKLSGYRTRTILIISNSLPQLQLLFTQYTSRRLDCNISAGGKGDLHFHQPVNGPHRVEPSRAELSRAGYVAPRQTLYGPLVSHAGGLCGTDTSAVFFVNKLTDQSPRGTPSMFTACITPHP